MLNQYHPFHIISPSPWPLLSGLLSLNLMGGFILMMSKKYILPISISLPLLILATSAWWRDVARESSFQGYHDQKVMNGLRMGMILFIVSEVLFFVSFFWMFFHSSLAPNMEMGNIWPPMGISAMNPFQIPLLNTIILLSSGVSVTWSHHALLWGNNQEMKKSLKFTIFLGIYFTLLQGWEYWDASFSFSDSVFGSSFFLATGFHGLRVLVGTLFLGISFLRFKMNIFSKMHHLGFEMSIWYWHFVDVVWLFLYSFLCWWAY
uniref:Cytochrome c oxidase subunit 3 n=1 Tax=Pseudobiotus spinifer TaxID=1477120 RepID=A0A0K0KA07_9BILA|nr:cytochrome c oxidase subunit III [Pseudobiotus spinifer]